jgi:hypothetical protein
MGMISKLILEGIMKKNESFLPRHLIHPLLLNPLQILQPLKQSINVSLPILTETPNAEAPGILNLGSRRRGPVGFTVQPLCLRFPKDGRLGETQR